jgi:hypothetical protein
LIPSLQIAGLTQQQIAEQLQVSRATIVHDLSDMHPAETEAVEHLKTLVSEIHAILPVEKRAQKYADLATKAKNEAVSLGALQRIDDLDGIVTEKERIRAKRDERPAIQALFMLAPGASIDFGGGTPQGESATISRGEGSLHNTSSTMSSSDTPTSSPDVERSSSLSSKDAVDVKSEDR